MHKLIQFQVIVFFILLSKKTENMVDRFWDVQNFDKSFEVESFSSHRISVKAVFVIFVNNDIVSADDNVNVHRNGLILKKNLIFYLVKLFVFMS